MPHVKCSGCRCAGLQCAASCSLGSPPGRAPTIPERARRRANARVFGRTQPSHWFNPTVKVCDDPMSIRDLETVALTRAKVTLFSSALGSGSACTCHHVSEAARRRGEEGQCGSSNDPCVCGWKPYVRNRRHHVSSPSESRTWPSYSAAAATQRNAHVWCSNVTHVLRRLWWCLLRWVAWTGISAKALDVALRLSRDDQHSRLVVLHVSDPKKPHLPPHFNPKFLMFTVERK